MSGAGEQQGVDAYDSYRGCRSKRRYPTEREANRKAAIAYELRGIWLRVYLCDQCGGWHLTHQGALPPGNWRPPARSQEDLRRERDDERRRDWRRRRGHRRNRGAR